MILSNCNINSNEWLIKSFVHCLLYMEPSDAVLNNHQTPVFEFLLVLLGEYICAEK